MKTHSISIVGVMAASAGWLWLAFGVGVDTSFRGDSVYNLHKGALAEQLCMLGYVLIVWGAIISGFSWLKQVDMVAIAAPTTAKTLAERNASPLRRAPPKSVPAVDSVLDAVELTESEPTPQKSAAT